MDCLKKNLCQIVENNNKSIVFFLLLIVLKSNLYAQIKPDSVYITYYETGKMQEQTGFYHKKKLQNKIYYEGGKLKEHRIYNTRKNIVKEFISLEENTTKMINIVYWNNGNKKNEEHLIDGGTVILDKHYHRSGELKKVICEFDKEREIFMVQKYNRRGRIRRTYYLTPLQ